MFEIDIDSGRKNDDTQSKPDEIQTINHEDYEIIQKYDIFLPNLFSKVILEKFITIILF